MSEYLLPIVFAIIAALFACVGQAGGAGYVGIMGLFGFDAGAIKSTALSLTVLVAAIGAYRFHNAGFLKWRDWYPFALLGAPFSVIGGALQLPGTAYRIVVAILLLAAAIQMVRSAKGSDDLDARALSEPPFLPAVLWGAAIGFVAGITGVGGGIFLAPLMLSLNWATTKRVAAAAQVNNLYTATSAFAGVWAVHLTIPSQLPWWATAAAIGGVFGSWLGAKHLPATTLRYLLAAILFVSGVKLLLG